MFPRISSSATHSGTVCIPLSEKLPINFFIHVACLCTVPERFGLRFSGDYNILRIIYHAID